MKLLFRLRSVPSWNMFEPSEPLDSEQLDAATATERIIAVLAGPGSGKTRTLSQRTRFLLGGDPDARALLLTFTNKAAAEMKSRAVAASGIQTDRLVAGTFHAFGVRVLRAHGPEVGIQREFTVLDDESRTELAESIAATAGLPDLSAQWSGTRLRLRDPTPLVGRFAEIFEREKRQLGVMDFDDLVAYTAKLFQEREEIAEVYGTRFRHLLIDEFQDTDPAQFSIVRALEPYVATISMFADDDQAIFSFRGGEARHVKEFVEALSASEYALTINYRSPSAIVDAANALIASDSAASGREMRTDRIGGEVRVLEFFDEHEEGRVLAQEILHLINDEILAEEISVLGPTATRLSFLAQALDDLDVPTTVWFGPSIMPDDLRELGTCLLVVRRTVNAAEASRLSGLVGAPADEEREVTKILEQGSEAAAVAALRGLREAAFSGVGPLEIVDRAQDVVGRISSDRGDALNDLRDVVKRWTEEDPDFSLDQLMTEIALGNNGGAVKAQGGVRVATIHRTKGLEWPRVYVLGLEQETMPRFDSMTNPALREQRRLCFVAVARCMDVLTLCRARVLRGFPKQPSQFLSEMSLSN
jgi:DNA helicase II / ATP-dependent DNA helicase PcrA